MWLVFPAAFATPTLVDLPASGRQQTEVRIERFGRVAFEVRSRQGARIQLVDRMEGPGPRAGRVGQEDGRLDRFVDRGDIRVVTEGPAEADGDLQVVVTPFERIGSAPQLTFRSHQRTVLRDRTERGWWIDHTDAEQTLHFEALGRHVGDLRLWRDGTWLVEDRPSCTTVEPVAGQPLRQCTLSAKAEPGLYQLVAYGGPGEPWAEEANDTDLHVRWDVERVRGSGRITGRLDSTGRRLLQVDADIDTAHLQLDDTSPAMLGFATLGDRSPFRPSGREGRITDESRTPEVTVTRSGNRAKVLAVEGPPGQPYTLTWFEDDTWIQIPSEQVLLTSLSDARPSDAFPPTVAVVERLEDARERVVADVSVKVASGQRFERRFNLLESQAFLLRVDEAAIHRLEVTEGQASIRVEPFFVRAPQRYVSPEARSGVWQESLSPRLYRVTLIPGEPGIVTLSITRNDWSDVAQRTVFDLEPVSLPSEVRLPLNLARTVHRYTAHLLQPAGIRRGLHLSPAPLDGTRHHAIALLPGERLPLQVVGPATIQALLPNGEPLFAPQDLDAGGTSIELVNPLESDILVALGPVPTTSQPRPLPPGRLSALPDFPTIAEATPRFLDLERSRAATFALAVDHDGLYHLQSTGLLATRGTLRNRVVTDLGSGDQNGVGRNFRIARFLRSGDYQVTVRTQGSTRGHLGVELAEMPMLDGGTLSPGEEARVTLPAETGVVYRFALDERKRVALGSGNPTTSFPCRLEDDDGWPVVRPVERCSLDVDLAPGSYVLRSLPGPVAGPRLTRLTTSAPPPVLTGHGPFAVRAGESRQKVWTEPSEDTVRPVDTFDLDVPATASVTLELGAEMGGEIRTDGELIGRIVPGRPWTGVLARGTHQVLVQAARRGTGIPYTLHTRTERLLVGQSRSTSLPGRLHLRVGEAGLHVIRSSGLADTRARLLGPDGELVATNDDRPDGWNFQIARWLDPGDYELEVTRVGRHGRTVVHLEAPSESVGAPMGQGGATLPVGPTPTVHPIEAGRRELVSLQAVAPQNLGLAVEFEQDGTWRSLGTSSGRSIATIVRRPRGAPLRARIWSIDGRSGEAEVQIRPAPTRASGESALAHGVSTDTPAALTVRGVQPGLFRVSGGRGGLSICRVPGRPCEPVPAVIALDRDVVLAGTRFHLQRADLDEPVPVELFDAPAALETGIGGLVAVTVRAGTTIPGLRLDGPHGTGSGDGASLAVGEGVASTWGAGGARIQAVALQQEKQTWDGETELELQIPAHTSLQVPLDRMLRLYPLALERGLFAESGGGGIWADGSGTWAELSGRDLIRIVNPTTTPLRATLLPHRELGRPLEPDGAIEWYATRAGRRLVPVEAGAGALRSHGADLVFRGADGTASTDGIHTDGAGWVEVEHGIGWVALWSEATRPGPRRQETQRLNLREPGVHRIAADGPFAAHIARPGAPEVAWRPEGGTVDVFVGSRPVRVGLRPLGDQPDVIAHQRMVGVRPLTEGLGPEVLLAGGEDAWFRFEVEEAGPIGVGVRATAERVEARVVASTGETVAEGVVAMPELTPGTWYLVLSQPAGAAPLRARPAIAGLEPPDTGPPADVVRSYLERAGFLATGDR